MTFGPDPATHTRCTVGGMIGNNSCGVHALMAGKTVDNIDELDILTYDGVRMRVGATSEDELARIIHERGRRGDIYAGLKHIRDTYADDIRLRYPKIPRRVSGYNLDSLLPEDSLHVAKALVGSESTCVVVLRAKCRLVHRLRFDQKIFAGGKVLHQRFRPDAGRSADVDHRTEIVSAGLEGAERAFHRAALRLAVEADEPVAEVAQDSADDCLDRTDQLPRSYRMAQSVLPLR